MMLLLAASLARGNSGVRVEIVQLLLQMLNSGLIPLSLRVVRLARAAI